MRCKKLDPVVPAVNLPAFGLEIGDLGTVVEMYDDNHVEAELEKSESVHPRRLEGRCQRRVRPEPDPAA